jgi:hypothetical protein
MTKIYKIRRKSDGKYSSGSNKPVWLTTGHVWYNMKNLWKHFKYNAKYHYDNYFNFTDYEIVEFELVETNTYQIDSTEINKNETLD